MTKYQSYSRHIMHTVIEWKNGNGEVEDSDAVETSADMATETLVTDRLQDIHIKRKTARRIFSGL